ncbi:MAG: glycerol kinase [Halobacteriovoraceae bacterium]|nr:glycerol kinase [Halobacteriovoraceae bacterium]
MNYILSIDQGTTGTTSLLIDSESFEVVDKINKEFPQIFPSPGLVEHDLNDIWNTVKITVEELINKNNVDPNSISCIGITNQRETTCAFDCSGAPLANAIVWQDRRTFPLCEELKNKGLEEKFKQKTGLTLDPYFSGSKMNWFLKNKKSIADAKSEGNLKFGTIDTFLLFKLSGMTSFKTEPSNASRTLLMDLETTQWSEELLNIFEIPQETLPEIVDSFSLFGTTKGLSFLPDGIPITGILGDQQAALFGQAGLQEGDVKCTYGTGAFMLLNTGEKIHYSKNGLLSTVAFRYKNQTIYALEGSCYIAGAAVGWLRDQLKIIKTSPDVENLAKKVTRLEEMENLLFLPFFTGIGSPYWKSDAKAAILGLTRDTDDSHIARACLDGIALSIQDLIEAMIEDTKLNLRELKVDGGAVNNDLLMEIQATISNLKIIKPKIIETTAYGAGLASAIGNNLIKKDQILSLWKKDKVIEGVRSNASFYQKKHKDWKEIIQTLFKVKN